MRFLLGTVLVLFSVYTGWIVWEFGYTSVFEVTLREHPSTQALIDLLIACGLLFFVMILDNRRSGRPFRKVAPFAIITILAGSIGPLLYFLVYSNLLKSKSEIGN
jgi:hypothetical protein